MLRSFVVLFLILAAGVSRAEEIVPTTAPGGGFTLPSLVARAMEHSELIASLGARLDQRRHAARQAGVWQNPEADLSGGLKSESGTGPLFEISVSQPVFYPGKQRLRREIGDLEAAVTGVELSETQLIVSMDAVRLAYRYGTGLRKKSINEDRQKRFELIRSYLVGHLFPSPQQKVERRLVETRLNNLTTEALQIQGDVQATFEALSFYVGFEAGALPEIEIPWLKGTGSIDKAQWLAAARENNLDLAGQKVRLDAARKETNLARLEAKPDFSPGVFYEHERGGETQHLVGAGISLPIPVLNRNLAGVESAERRVEAEQRLLRYSEQKVAAEVKQLWSEYEATRLAAQRYPESLPKQLDGSLKGADEEFRKGRLDLLTYLELDSEIAETKFRALDAQVALVDKLLDLLLLAGERDIVSALAAR